MQKSTCAAKTLLIKGLAKNIVPRWQKYRVRFLGAPNLHEGPTNLTHLDALGRARVTHLHEVRLPTLPNTLDSCAELAAAYVGLHLRELASVCAWLRFGVFEAVYVVTRTVRTTG